MDSTVARDDKPRRRARWLRGVAGTAVVLVVIEIALRVRFGLGNPPLYVADARCGYRPLPSRHYRRFGNRFTVNVLSQRSEADPETKPAGKHRVLCVGDSVTNGGAKTDDAATYPARLENALGGGWDALNASTGGWALANELGYLQEFGTSKADVVVLQVGTQDLFQPFAPPSTAGTSAYPSSAPPLAIVELVNRYLLPRLLRQPEAVDPGVNIDEHSPVQLVADLRTLAQEIELVRKTGAKPLVWYVRMPPKSRAKFSEENEKAFAALQHDLRERNVPMADLTTELDREGGDALFRDDIHPNEKGNEVIARLLAPRVKALGES